MSGVAAARERGEREATNEEDLFLWHIVLQL